MNGISYILQSGNFISAFGARLPLLTAGALVVSVPAIILAFIPAALVCGKKSSTKRIFDILFLLLVFIPPVSVSLITAFVFRKTLCSEPLIFWIYDLVMEEKFVCGLVAAFAAALPIMYLFVRKAYEKIDPDMIAAARTLGLSGSMIFRSIIVPEIKGGIICGAILAFARAFAELSVYLVIDAFGYFTGLIWVIAILLIVAVILSVVHTAAAFFTVNRKR